MKAKNFRIDPRLADAFEAFCAERHLIERQVVSSLLAHFMQQSPEAREAILLQRWPPSGPVASIQPEGREKVAAKPARKPHYAPAKSSKKKKSDA